MQAVVSAVALMGPALVWARSDASATPRTGWDAFVMIQRWIPSLFLLALAVIVAVVRPSLVGLLAAAFVLLLAVVTAPLTGVMLFPRSVSAAEAARRSAEDGRPIIFWRPGCPFCLRLRATLIGRTSRALWVNIWDDPQGAAAVREVAGGNETVPTVLWGADAHVNPDPRWVRDRMNS